MKTIDLNCDLGESFGAYRMGMDAEILPLITSANIACGFHASDPVTMDRTVAEAVRAGAGIGAHPGFPDLAGFGRREMKLSAADIRGLMLYQMGALAAFAAAHGARLQHVKPHGALYNMAQRDDAMADAVCEAVAAFDDGLTLLGLPGSCVQAAAQRHGLRYAREVFADRAYEEDGSLVRRGTPGALITDREEAARRVLRIVTEGRVRAVTGRDVALEADSVCVHGDGPTALAMVRRVREVLEEAGVKTVPMGRG